jgi:hypothetical protein
MQNKTLKHLLKIQMERLEIALTFEREKKITIPETTAIIKTILEIESKGDKSGQDFDF